MAKLGKDKFSDPRWHAKCAELIRKVEGKCEDCDSDDEVRVLIGFWIKGEEPWDYPDKAYRCLCRFHRELWEKADQTILGILPSFSSQELDALANALKAISEITVDRSISMHRLYSQAKHDLYEFEQKEELRYERERERGSSE